MTFSEKLTLFVASVPALISFLGIYYNYKLSKKLQTTDEEEKEKRELRNKIQDRLAEFEEQCLPSLNFSPKISQRFVYLARNVKMYDSSLSTMIRIFVQDWKKMMNVSNEKPKQSEIYHFKSYADNIGSKADNLLANLSVVERVRIYLSWIKFRINLFKGDLENKHKRYNS